MLWQWIIAIIKKRFEGQRLSHPQRKAYPLAQGIVPYQSDVLAWDLGVVGEGLWTSKRSNVMTMHHHDNEGVFWGPKTLSSQEKSISTCSGDCLLSIQCVGMGLKAFYGALLWGSFCLRRPWWWWLDVVGRWPSVAWCLHQHKPRVGIVQIYLRNSVFCLNYLD